MEIQKLLLQFFVTALLVFSPGKDFAQPVSERKVLPIGGNAWSNRATGGLVTNEGIADWTDSATSFTIYFRVSRVGALHVWLNAAVPSGKTLAMLSIGGLEKVLKMSGEKVRRYDAGVWTLGDTGYQSIQIRGLSRSGKVFAAVQSVELAGAAVDGSVGYVPNNEGNFFHWGRRGASVHLNYPLPDGVHAEWFYNEVTVPEGQDIEGSYFMADGFAEGYFGMQVNSPTERHILFSVWSPFKTDDPTSIPDTQRVLLVRKGDRVHAGTFGDEGSGGQSWLNYAWKAGTTYRFLLRGQPVDRNYTQFTAWWFAPEEAKWLLIASFKRPQTQTWLTHLHSFLENFEPDMGDRTRSVFFSQQWIRDSIGRWQPLTKAGFSGDNTARKGYRMDYGGGVKGDSFYLRNGGFFNTSTIMGQLLERDSSSGAKAPDIDVTNLP